MVCIIMTAVWWPAIWNFQVGAAYFIGSFLLGLKTPKTPKWHAVAAAHHHQYVLALYTSTL